VIRVSTQIIHSQPISQYRIYGSKLDDQTMRKFHNACKSLVILALSATLIACNGGGGARAEQAPPPDQTALTPTVGEVLRELEESGQLPKLDRSTSPAGVDSNSDGLRDDVAEYIEKLPDSPDQKSSLRQLSRAITEALVLASGPADAASLEAARKGIAAAVNCLGDQYDRRADRSQRLKEIQKITVNTRGRFTAYDAFNSSASGTMTELPNGDTCDRK
jgi:hypothetical protein